MPSDQTSVRPSTFSKYLLLDNRYLPEESRLCHACCGLQRVHPPQKEKFLSEAFQMTKLCPCTYLGVEIARDASTEIDLSERPETPDEIFDSAGPTATRISTSGYSMCSASAVLPSTGNPNDGRRLPPPRANRNTQGKRKLPRRRCS